MIVAPLLLAAAAGAAPDRLVSPVEERVRAERGLLVVRIDPKPRVPAEACQDLAARDVAVTVGGVPARVTGVERLQRPERHWLLVDTSPSAEGRRNEAKRSAIQYLDEVMAPGLDSAALLAVDEDIVLVTGPTTDPEVLASEVEPLTSGLSSALRDGLDTVLRQIEGDRHEHLVLFWTDGLDIESITGTAELYETIERTPNATVFPIALLPTSRSLRGPPIGPFLFEVARRSGGEVFASSDPRWLDRVRGWIARRFTVAFVPPAPTPDGPVEVTLSGRACVATVLRDPFARPDAVAGAARPVPDAWRRIHDRSRKLDDAACAATNGTAPWAWPLSATPDGLGGCVLDLVVAHGPLVRGKGRARSFDPLPARLAARDVRIAAPALDALPRSLDEAIERLHPPPGAPGETRSPLLLEGSALLSQRARIAASLFASRNDYREFATLRLAALAQDDLASIGREIARSFPELGSAQVASVARSSRAGRRALGSIERPTDADLARVLAAWLGDLPARELFDRYERSLIDAAIENGPDPEAPARWAALRSQLALPEAIRVAGPLILVRDEPRDLVGFWRVVLPRPAGYYERADPRTSYEPRAEDRVPERPLGSFVANLVAADPRARAHLSAFGYRATRVVYGPGEPAWKTPPDRPFRRVKMEVTLEGAAGRVVLRAELHAPDDGPVAMSKFSARVEGDPELARLIGD